MARTTALFTTIDRCLLCVFYPPSPQTEVTHAVAGHNGLCTNALRETESWEQGRIGHGFQEIRSVSL